MTPLQTEHMAEYERRLCVCGYHVYQDVWDVALGETLICSREKGNSHDRMRYAEWP